VTHCLEAECLGNYKHWRGLVRALDHCLFHSRHEISFLLKELVNHDYFNISNG
jgi:hypothetical protein